VISSQALNHSEFSACFLRTSSEILGKIIERGTGMLCSGTKLDLFFFVFVVINIEFSASRRQIVGMEI